MRLLVYMIGEIVFQASLRGHMLSKSLASIFTCIIPSIVLKDVICVRIINQVLSGDIEKL